MEPEESLAAGCQARGLQVMAGAPLAHLSALPDAALGAVSIFHTVHKLSLEQWLVLFDAAARVLRPGGILDCRTPG